jgi:hypothetical protein
MNYLIKAKLLLIALAVTAIMPAALDAQARPTFVGDPNLIRDGLDTDAYTEPALSAIAMDAEAGINWGERAINAGMTVKENRLVLNVMGASREGRDDNAGGLIEQVLRQGMPQAEVRPGSAPDLRHVLIDPFHLSEMQMLLDGRIPELRIEAYRAPVANAYGFEGTEGEGAMRAELLDLTGDGVTVAIMDLGFRNLDAYPAETGTVIRRPAQADYTLEDSDHGTAMVEVIRDMAPEATILAYRIDENQDIYSATMDAIAQGVRIIVCPLSWFDVPGSSLADRAAHLAAGNGLVWVSSAGNFADGRYWEAATPPTTMRSGEVFVDFSVDDPYQFLSDVGGEQITVHFVQEQRGSDDAQIALELYSWNGMSADLVLEARGNQNHRVQTISHPGEAGLYYFPMLRVARDGNINRLRMFSESGLLYFNRQEGSVTSPGGNPAVITVGAVDAQNYTDAGSVEPYSGRGGGIFGLNVDLCGPTAISTGIYGPQGFSGTSAAAAHLAGLIALNAGDAGLGKDPAGLIRRIDIMEAGHDIHSGSGLATAFVDDAERDNDPRSATDLNALGMMVGDRSLSPSHDEDWFRFVLDMPARLDITQVGGIPSLQLYQVTDEGGENEGATLVGPAGSLSYPDLWEGVYLLRATGGFVADYSLVLETSHDAPPPVSDLLPADGENVIVKSDSDNLSVEFSWNPVVAPGMVLYQVRVYRNGNSDDLHADMSTTDSSMEIAGFESGQTYSFEVRAINQHGESEFSRLQSFTVYAEGKQPPTMVEGLSPADGGKAPAILNGSGQQQIELSWKQAEGPGLILYQVQVLRDDGRTQTLHADLSTFENRLVVVGVEIDGNYIWRVRAINEFGDSGFTADHSFTVVDSSALEPVNGEADLADASTVSPVQGSVSDGGSATDAAGCVGGTSGTGMIGLLLALLAAGAIRTKRVNGRTQA